MEPTRNPAGRITRWLLAMALFAGGPALAWDGQDTQSGEVLVFPDRTQMAVGAEVEYTDDKGANPRRARVEQTLRLGSRLTVTLVEIPSGKQRTVEMDRYD